MEGTEGYQHEDIMIEIKYKSWNEVSIGLYNKISEVCSRDCEPLDKNIALIALLSETPEDDIWDLRMDEVEKLFKDITWVFDFKFNQKWHGKKIKINGNSYDVCVDLQKFSISQYIDFQELWPKLKDSNDAYSQILATFIIPEGKKYNKDYDLRETILEIENYLPISQANSVLYFFLISLARSIRATEICYTQLMKILMRRTKTKEEKEKIKMLEKETLKMIKQAQLIIGSL